MKKGVKDLLKVYEKHNHPNIDINEIKRKLIFKPKRKWYLTFKLAYVFLAIFALIIAMPLLSPKDNPDLEVEPMTLSFKSNIYVKSNSDIEFYLKNHFEYYGRMSVYHINVDNETTLTLYVGLEDDRIYLIQSVHDENYTVSYTKGVELLKETSYSMDHFMIDKEPQTLTVQVSKGNRTGTIDIELDVKAYTRH